MLAGAFRSCLEPKFSLQARFRSPPAAPTAPHGETPAPAAHGLPKSSRVHHGQQRPHHGCPIDAVRPHRRSCWPREGHHLPERALLQHTHQHHEIQHMIDPATLLEGGRPSGSCIRWRDVCILFRRELWVGALGCCDSPQ